MLKFLILGISVVLTGCATPPPIEFTPERLPKVSERINADIRSISVRTAPQPEQVGDGVNWYRVEFLVGNPLFPTSTGTGIPITKQWESALNTAINENLIFTDNPDNNVSLFVDIKQIELSGIATAKTDVMAQYRLMNRATGDDLYTKDILSIGSASTGESFGGVVRGRIALVRSIKNNINKFLESLVSDAPNINKRMENAKQ